MYAEARSPIATSPHGYLSRALCRERQRFHAVLLSPEGWKTPHRVHRPYPPCPHLNFFLCEAFPSHTTPQIPWAFAHPCLSEPTRRPPLMGFCQDHAGLNRGEVESRLLHHWIGLPLKFPYPGAELWINIQQYRLWTCFPSIPFMLTISQCVSCVVVVTLQIPIDLSIWVTMDIYLYSGVHTQNQYSLYESCARIPVLWLTDTLPWAGAYGPHNISQPSLPAPSGGSHR